MALPACAFQARKHIIEMCAKLAFLPAMLIGSEYSLEIAASFGRG
jgi:hypothetical protein